MMRVTGHATGVSVFALYTLVSQVIPTVIATDSTGCPDCFMGRCTCSSELYPSAEAPHPAPMLTVNCSHAGLLNTHVLACLPAATQVLILSHNSIERLPSRMFGSQPPANLSVLEMTDNGLMAIEADAFQGAWRVHTLRLDNNRLYAADDKLSGSTMHGLHSLRRLSLNAAFSRLPNSSTTLASLKRLLCTQAVGARLHALQLSNNHLTAFDDADNYCLCCNHTVSALRSLSLAHNALASFRLHGTCLVHLSHVDLRANRLTTLDSHTRTQLARARNHSSASYSSQLLLSNNSWRCAPCSRADRHLSAWLLSFSGADSQLSTCARAAHTHCPAATVPTLAVLVACFALGFVVSLLCAGACLYRRLARATVTERVALTPCVHHVIERLWREPQYSSIRTDE